ncbi:MAG: ribonuclease P protein component [Bacteroidales bacterium]|nr:ribonuclease P protein component [Bacteroidales bacterium]
MEGEVRNTLLKKERLCGKTSISKLLAKGKHGSVPGIRYQCLYGTDSGVNRILVSVSKKFFKRAVKRNLLKRRIRESWRRQKHLLNLEGNFDILLIYSVKEILTYEEIYSSIGQVIENLNAKHGPKQPAEVQEAPLSE